MGPRVRSYIRSCVRRSNSGVLRKDTGSRRAATSATCWGRVFVRGLGVVCVFFAVARAHADTIFAANYYSNSIVEFNSSGASLTFASGLNEPTAMAIDGNGDLFVGDSGDGTIWKITPSGTMSLFDPSGGNVGGMACDSSGNLYVSAFGNYGGNNGVIVKFTPSGSPSVFATGLSDPMGLAFDSQGNLYVANHNNNAIEKFGTNGVGSVFVSSGLNQPSGLAIDGSGNVYVTDIGVIDKFDPSGTNESVYFGGGEPQALAFDSGGNLFASYIGFDPMILEFDTGGSPSLFASGLDVSAIVAEVPEPGTWGLVVLGCGVFLIASRLRRCWTS